MKKYQSHKIVSAARITSVSGNWATADNPFGGTRIITLENGVDVSIVGLSQFDRAEAGGYYVLYPDGYSSFSPADAFEAGYTEINHGSFGYALSCLKAGYAMTRAGWNGKGLSIKLQRPDAHSKMSLPYVYLNYPGDAQNTPGARVPWVPSQTDQLSEDWAIVSVSTDNSPAPLSVTRSEHQQRVRDEYADLAEKIAKLKAFFGTTIFGGLPDGERHRMERQLDAMESYAGILTDRIAYF